MSESSNKTSSRVASKERPGFWRTAGVKKIFGYARLGAQVGIVQVLVQGISFASGILIIRVLSPEKYALYTLAYTLLGSMTVLADGGIGSGVMAQGGQVWKDRTRLGAVLRTGLVLRRRFSIAAIIVAIPVLIYLLRSHEASWIEVTSLVLAILPMFYVLLSESLLNIIPKLHQRIAEMQKIAVQTNILRFALLCVAILALPYAAVIIFMTGLATIWGNRKTWALTASICDTKQPEDPEVRSEILKIVRRVMPGSIYYSLSGSLSIWLISIFGSTEAVSQVGALGRIARVMLLISSVFGFLIVPRFARLGEDKKLLLIRFLQLQLLLWGISVLVFATISAAPNLILGLLGENYSGLGRELSFQALAMGVGFACGSTNLLGAARGWILPPLVLIPTQLCAQVAGIIIFDPSTVSGVILISILPIFSLFLVRFYYILVSIRKLKPSDALAH